MRRVVQLTLGFCLLALGAKSQHVYWVTFGAKDSSYSVLHPNRFLSDRSIERRKKWNIPITEMDLPLNQSYISVLEQHGCTVLSKSKWHNSIAVKVSEKKDAEFLKRFSFVKNIRYLGVHKPIRTSASEKIDLNEMLKVLDAKFDTFQSPASDTTFYGKSWNQVKMTNTQWLHQQNFQGQNILVAVLDAGFKNVDQLATFHHLFTSKRIVATFDCIQRDSSVFEDDDHGMAVLSCMASNLPGIHVGTAPQASYALLRSEYAVTEMPVEETFWAEAIEFADSLGANIVNSSLGYNEFDDSYFNYSYKDLNGKKSIISNSANIAVEKGMVVVVSAGNEGDEDWRFISVPADADNVITVGGVTTVGDYVGFSSIGPTADKRIKPDITAQADNVWVASARGVFYQGDGTSYSAPLVTGSIACLMQAFPDKKPEAIKKALLLSGDTYYHPNQFRGSGIPDMELAYAILKADSSHQLSALDVRKLDDKRLHLTCFSPTDTKVNVTIRNSVGEVMITDRFALPSGEIKRIALKKNKKIVAGSYTLQLQTNDYSIVKNIILHK
jgi:subtilisin family serine protease